MDLLRELEAHRYSRVPFVDPDNRLVYIAHRSMLDQFVSKRARTGNISDLGQLTMADLFAEQPEFESMFSGTAAFVGSEGTLADARAGHGGRPKLLRRVRNGVRERAGACAGLDNRRDHCL